MITPASTGSGALELAKTVPRNSPTRKSNNAPVRAGGYANGNFFY
jgi:hypothetical protein